MYIVCGECVCGVYEVCGCMWCVYVVCMFVYGIYVYVHVDVSGGWV